jgi:hypothetical protein
MCMRCSLSSLLSSSSGRTAATSVVNCCAGSACFLSVGCGCAVLAGEAHTAAVFVACMLPHCERSRGAVAIARGVQQEGQEQPAGSAARLFSASGLQSRSSSAACMCRMMLGCDDIAARSQRALLAHFPIMYAVCSSCMVMVPLAGIT